MISNDVTKNREQQMQVPAPPESATPMTPMTMLYRAVDRGVDMEQLTQLMDLHDRWEKAQARNAFTAGMAAFKAEPIKILKSKKVDIPGGAKFSHATIADVVDGVVSALSKHGFSHRWVSAQDPATSLITVSCVLTHALGHSEVNTMSGMPDDSGKKNGIQQIASTTTYLQRYTLLAVTGLAAKDMPDIDDQRPHLPVISEDQAMTLETLLTEVGADLSAFYKWAKVTSIRQIPIINYQACLDMIKKRREALVK